MITAEKRRFKTLNFNIYLIIFIGGQFERFIKKSLLLLRITIICPVFSCAAVSPSPDNSHRFSFNPDFLQLSDGDNAKNIDLNYFANASGAAPGNILLM